MKIAKLLASAALAAAPLSIAAAQSTPADSGSNGNRGEWIAGAGALAGAGLFMAFARSSHDGSSTATSGFTFKNPGTNPSAPSASTPNGTSTQSNPSTPGDGSTPPDTGAVNTPPDTGTVTPPDTGTVTPPDTGTVTPPLNQRPQDDTSQGNPQNPPPNMQSDVVTTNTSTVPEPGSLVLLATGIVGLAPLVRRRRK